MERTQAIDDAGTTGFRADTPWGPAVIHADGLHVTHLRPPVPAQADDDLAALPSAAAETSPGVVRELAAALAAYFSGEPVALARREDVARWLQAAGINGFRLDVSLALVDVPRGVTLSYGELATLAGRPGAARAAGSACARNPLPIVVPCHRVVHAGSRPGDVGAYGAGTGSEYKRRLLQLELAPLALA